MYNVKKVKYGLEEDSDPMIEEIVPCVDYTVTTYPPDSPWGHGIIIDLSFGARIHIPNDCDEVYIMNERGDNVDSYPRVKKLRPKPDKEMRILS